MSLKFEIPAHISKQLIQIWNNFFGRLGDLKNESHFLKKKKPLAINSTFEVYENLCLTLYL